LLARLLAAVGEAQEVGVSQCKRFSYLLARFLAAVGEAQEVGVSQCKRFSHLLTRLLAAVGEAPRREGISVSVSLTC